MEEQPRAGWRPDPRGFGIGLVIAALLQGEQAGYHFASFTSRQFVVPAVVQMLLFGLVARPLLLGALTSAEADKRLTVGGCAATAMRLPAQLAMALGDPHIRP